ncbi:hypothetical protein Cni_G23578 [Canna indica]|uniref:Uncharacterized protein n=1 Tax=Canna indica TaxID=4628 RepID=A0AAQ3KWD9_9LILI|nr:hypothetical protein Cni_G23578 [Canna indica]
MDQFLFFFSIWQVPGARLLLHGNPKESNLRRKKMVTVLLHELHQLRAWLAAYTMLATFTGLRRCSQDAAATLRRGRSGGGDGSFSSSPRRDGRRHSERCSCSTTTNFSCLAASSCDSYYSSAHEATWRWG